MQRISQQGVKECDNDGNNIGFVTPDDQDNTGQSCGPQQNSGTKGEK